MKVSRLKVSIYLALVLLPTWSGCSGGDGLDRVGMSGHVTFRGEPVAEGEIRWDPQPGTRSPVVIEAITDGRYATAKSGGVPPGSFRVELRAYDSSTPERKYPGDPPRKQLLPARYNTQSKLEQQVKSGQPPIERDFELAP